MPQVYAVVFEPGGTFLIAIKALRGYFFKGRTIASSSGIQLNGGGLVALPGGGLEAFETPIDGAVREFNEETDYSLNVSTAQQTILDTNRFKAVYFLVDLDTLNTIKSAASIAINNSLKIVEAIRGKMISAHAEVTDWATLNELATWPADNELQTVYLMNVNNNQDWASINSWQNDPIIGWYFIILEFLRNRIIPGVQNN